MIYVIFLIPILMIITGYLMHKYPPKKINHIVGYRTSKSMKNKRNWTKANKTCGLLWIKLGTINIFISILLYIFKLLNIINITEQLLSLIIIIQVIIILISIPIVENKLKGK